MSEVRIMGFNYPPRGWAQCNGQLLPIAQNQALFALLGTQYGGDGIRTFGLPNLQGRIPIHRGAGYVIGQVGGEQAHVLTTGEDPVHTHTAFGTSTAADSQVAAGNYLGSVAGTYGLPSQPSDSTQLHPTTIGTAGQSQAHDNLQPYLTVNFCIALQGAFPSPN